MSLEVIIAQLTAFWESTSC